MQVLNNVLPNSPEWLALRRVKIGASDCAAIVGENPYCSPHKVWRQKIFGEEEFINGDMQRGVRLEEKAREWVSKTHGIEYKPVCVESEKRPWQIATMDCFYQDGEFIFAGEIKSPREKKFESIKKKGIPDYWMWQVQHQLSVLNLQRMFFLLYTESDQHLIWVHRNEEMISKLNSLEEVFYFEYLSRFVPPPYTREEKQYIENLTAI